MPDQTPEVCAEVFAGGRCGEPEDADCHGFDESHDHRPKSRCHPFRPAEPTPAERPEGWQRDVEYDGTRTVTRRSVRWVSGDDEWVIPVELERAISSAAVAEAEDRWRTAEREVDRLRSILGRLRKRYERVSTVYQVREADNDIRRILSESFTPEDAAVNTRAEAAERALEEASEAIDDLAMGAAIFGRDDGSGQFEELMDRAREYIAKFQTREHRALVSTESREDGGER